MIEVAKNAKGEIMDIEVSCIVNINNNIALIKTESGYLLPNKKLEDSELLKEAVIKAVKEETNLDVIPNAMFGVYDNIDRRDKRVLGIFYITHLDISNEDAENIVKNSKNKVVFLPIIDIVKEKFCYDHGLVLNNYFRLLMLGSQSFSNKKN